MKNEMEEIDILIRETLNEEEAKFYDALEEQSILEMLFGLYKGKNAWINILLNLFILVFFILFIYSVIQFFNVESTEELIKWGFGSIIFMMFISMLKLYAWMQMDKNALIREVKRLELQIMALSGKFSDNK